MVILYNTTSFRERLSEFVMQEALKEQEPVIGNEAMYLVFIKLSRRPERRPAEHFVLCP